MGIEATNEIERRIEPGREKVIRVVIADDHPVVRTGLKVLIQDTQDIECVGCPAWTESAC